jgi:PAS domain S-box-containing protein
MIVSRRNIAISVLLAVAIGVGWAAVLRNWSGGLSGLAYLLLLVVVLAVQWQYDLLAGIMAVVAAEVAAGYVHLWMLRKGARPLPSPLLWRNIAAAGAVVSLLIWLFELQRSRGIECEGQRRELRVLLDSMNEAVIVFDAEARVVNVNGAALKLAGRDESEILGKSVEALSMVVRPETENSTLVRRALQGMPSINVERVYTDQRDGRRIFATVTAVPVAGPVRGAILIVSDVTETRALQSRLLENERYLATGQMAAGVTHDFSNYLEVIEKAAVMLEISEHQPAEERRKYLEMVRHAVQRGADTVRRLREYLAGGTGEMRQVDVNEIARDSIELTRPLWKMRRNLSVTEDFKLVPAVRGNPVDLRRVITNLILNAIEAMGEEGGTVRVHTEFEYPIVRCAVADTGPGIPPEDQRKIFTPYYTTKAEGTGLGLAGAQKIILAHGGNLTFYSEPGSGTQFNIELPVADYRPGELPVEPPHRPERRARPA